MLTQCLSPQARTTASNICHICVTHMLHLFHALVTRWNIVAYCMKACRTMFCCCSGEETPSVYEQKPLVGASRRIAQPKVVAIGNRNGALPEGFETSAVILTDQKARFEEPGDECLNDSRRMPVSANKCNPLKRQMTDTPPKYVMGE